MARSGLGLRRGVAEWCERKRWFEGELEPCCAIFVDDVVETFGKYTLVKLVGSGLTADVFVARTKVAQGLDKTLVIKRLKYKQQKELTRVFVDEAKTSLALNHPNIAQTFDFGSVSDHYFIAMEYVEGVDLLRLLQEAGKRARRLPYLLTGYIVYQVARGLDYAHRKTDENGVPLGIVHRDVSLGNILLGWDGAVKLTDFGLARARDIAEQAGLIKGRYAYMSPEQARGEPIDCRSDVFSLGIVLWELACARPLFHAQGREALEMVRACEVPRARRIAPELPDALDEILVRALAPSRADRYQTARDFQAALLQFLRDWGLVAGLSVDSGTLSSWIDELVFPDRARKKAVPPPPAPVSSRPPRSAPLPALPAELPAAIAELERRLSAPSSAEIADLRALRDDLENVDHEGYHALGHCRLASFYIAVGRPWEANKVSSKAIGIDDPLVRAYVGRVQAGIARLLGDVVAAKGSTDEALADLEKFEAAAGGERPSDGVLRIRAEVMTERGLASRLVGKHGEAIEDFAEALVIFRALGQQHEEARTLARMAQALLAVGELEEARAHYKSAIKVEAALG